MRNHSSKVGCSPSVMISAALGGLIAIGVLGLAQTVNAQNQPFVGEVVCGGWNFCPTGWGECNGQLVPISEYEVLFQLIGTTYGGDGQNTFAFPDIRGRTMVGQGQSAGTGNRVIGEKGGIETVTLTQNQIPAHTHVMVAHTNAEKSASPANRIAGLAPASAPVYTSSAPNTALKASTLSSVGGSQSHNNMQPYLAVKCCISLFGIFPSPS